MAITLDPIEFTLIISITPMKIAINAIARANSFITASGSKRCGKNVSANEIGPPRTVSETIRVANKASDSIT
jgi:hypothetical protein